MPAAFTAVAARCPSSVGWQYELRSMALKATMPMRPIHQADLIFGAEGGVGCALIVLLIRCVKYPF